MTREVSPWIRKARHSLVQQIMAQFEDSSTLEGLRLSAYNAIASLGRHIKAEKGGLFDILRTPPAGMRFSQIKEEFTARVFEFLKETIK